MTKYTLQGQHFLICMQNARLLNYIIYKKKHHEINLKKNIIKNFSMKCHKKTSSKNRFRLDINNIQ